MVIEVLVIDMIRDFVTGKFENERAKGIISSVRVLLNSARALEKPVVYVSDAHPKDDHEFSTGGTHAVAGLEGSEIISELEPEENDHTIWKTKYSAFYDTGLDSLLEEWNVGRVVLSGVLTHICIQHTAVDAFFRGYDVVIPGNCVEDFSDEENESSQKFIEENYGGEILDLDELVARW